jgi:hypothetical protein
LDVGSLGISIAAWIQAASGTRRRVIEELTRTEAASIVAGGRSFEEMPPAFNFIMDQRV